MMKNKKTMFYILCYNMIVFVLIMVKSRFLKVPASWRTFNLIPFTGYFNQGYSLHFFTTIFVRQMLTKFFLFMPLGAYLSYKRIFFKQAVLCLLISSTLVACLKFFTGFGAFDSTDLLLNTLGAMIAYLILSAIFKRQAVLMIRAQNDKA